jgi:hypothetical protein
MGKTPFPMIVIFCVCVRDKVSGHPVRKECLPMLMLSIPNPKTMQRQKRGLI